MWPEGATQPPDDDDVAAFTYPEGDYLRLSSSVTLEEDEFVLYLQAFIDDAAFPFKLDVLIGARFNAGDDQLPPDRAEKTLVWMSYPYLRELVASITGRSPLP